MTQDLKRTPFHLSCCFPVEEETIDDKYGVAVVFHDDEEEVRSCRILHTHSPPVCLKYSIRVPCTEFSLFAYAQAVQCPLHALDIWSFSANLTIERGLI